MTSPVNEAARLPRLPEPVAWRGLTQSYPYPQDNDWRYGPWVYDLDPAKYRRLFTEEQMDAHALAAVALAQGAAQPEAKPFCWHWKLPGNQGFMYEDPALETYTKPYVFTALYTAAQPETLLKGGRTGAPPGMLQDDSRELSKWLSAKPNAKHEARGADQAADFWFKHDDDLRYVRRVLEAGRSMTDEDRQAAIAIIHALRTTVRGFGAAREAAQPVALSEEARDAERFEKLGALIAFGTWFAGTREDRTEDEFVDDLPDLREMLDAQNATVELAHFGNAAIQSASLSKKGDEGG